MPAAELLGCGVPAAELLSGDGRSRLSSLLLMMVVTSSTVVLDRVDWPICWSSPVTVITSCGCSRCMFLVTALTKDSFSSVCFSVFGLLMFALVVSYKSNLPDMVVQKLFILSRGATS